MCVRITWSRGGGVEVHGGDVIGVESRGSGCVMTSSLCVVRQHLAQLYDTVGHHAHVAHRLSSGQGGNEVNTSML